MLTADEFEPEFLAMTQDVQDQLTAMVALLREFGPELRRPHCDTLKGSLYANMKELRFFAASGVWRVACAFDPLRQAILLVAGDKSGVNQQRFYRRLTAVADRRFALHLEGLKGG